MSVSFSQFSKIYDAPGEELTEEQLNEIFGMFASDEKKAAAKALKAKIEFEKRKAQRDQQKNDQQTELHASSLKRTNFSPATVKAPSKLDTTPWDKLSGGQLRALDRNPFGESVKR